MPGPGPGTRGRMGGGTGYKRGTLPKDRRSTKVSFDKEVRVRGVVDVGDEDLGGTSLDGRLLSSARRLTTPVLRTWSRREGPS